MTSAPEHPIRLPMKNRFVGGAVERILGLGKIIECYDDRPNGCNTQEFLDFLVAYWGIELKTGDGVNPQEKIPREGVLIDEIFGVNL